ncbi:hypothetical protein AB0H57_02665 [Micromonospora sp. NPDC050686]
MTDPTQALSFGAAAAEYDRHRPRYPQAALRWAGEHRAAVPDRGPGARRR